MLARTSNVTRSKDAIFINAVVNDPDVRPFVGPGDDFLDMSELVANPAHMFLMGEYGGFLLEYSCPRVYQVHTFILKAGRGPWAREAAAAGIQMARESGAERLWTQVAPGLANVIAFAEGMGMKSTGDTLLAFGTPHLVYEMSL